MHMQADISIQNAAQFVQYPLPQTCIFRRQIAIRQPGQGIELFADFVVLDHRAADRVSQAMLRAVNQCRI